MNITVYEENQKKRMQMQKIIRNAEPQVDVTGFGTVDKMLEYTKACHPEVAFISMENSNGRGYFLIKEIKKLSPKTNLIAVADTYRYVNELLRLRISGYIAEDFTKEDVLDELENLRY